MSTKCGLALLPLCIVFVLTEPLFGETWLARKEQWVAESTPNSRKRLERLFEYNVALYNDDLAAALESSNETVALAERLAGSSLLAGALMQRARIKHQHLGPAASRNDYERAVSLFTEGGSEIAAATYWIGRVVHDKQIAGPDVLESYVKNALDCCRRGDLNELKAMIEATIVLRFCPHLASISETTVSQRLGHSPFTVLFRTAEFMDPSIVLDRAMLQKIDDALAEPLCTEIRSIHIHLLSLKSKCLASAENFQDALRANELALVQARKLAATSTLAQLLVMRSEFANAADETKTALSAIREATELLSKTDEPVFSNEQLAQAIRVLQTNNDDEGLRKLVSATLTQRDEENERRSQALAGSLQKLISRQVEKDALLNQTSKMLETSETQLSKQRRNLRNILFGSIGIFAAYLFISTLHVRRMNRKLARQIESYNQSRKERDLLEQKIAQVERMDRLGMLAGGIAHDFNNLLVGVLGNAEVLRMNSEEGLHQDCVDSIIRSAKVAADLSQKMLTYAGRRTSSMSTCELGHLAEELLPLLRSGLRSSCRIEFTRLTKEALTIADPSQIEQVLLNLVSNAIDVSAKGGTVHIRVGRETIDNPVDVPGIFGQRSRGGSFVFLEVEDEGPGISNSTLNHMFEPFFSTKEGGRGLGLSVVYGYVNKHDGLISCDSRVGEGTRIRVLLPELAETEDEYADSGLFFADDTPIDSRIQDTPISGSILIVDDEPSVGQVIQRFLVKQECKSKICVGGREAISFLELQPGKIDCVLLDLVMPETDGDQVIEWMRGNAPSLPIIVMTGYSNRNLDDYLKLPNVAGILEKPFSRSKLFAEVRQAIDTQQLSRINRGSRPN